METNSLINNDNTVVNKPDTSGGECNMGYDYRTDDVEEEEEKEEPDGILSKEDAGVDSVLAVFGDEKDECKQIEQSGDIAHRQLPDEITSELEVGIYKKKRRKKRKPRSHDDVVEDDIPSQPRRRKKKKRVKKEHPGNPDDVVSSSHKKYSRELSPLSDVRRTSGFEFESAEHDREADDEIEDGTVRHADDIHNKILRKYELTSDVGDIRTSAINEETEQLAHDASKTRTISTEGHQNGSLYKSKRKGKQRNTDQSDHELQLHKDARRARAENVPIYSATTTESSRHIEDLFITNSSVRDTPNSAKYQERSEVDKKRQKKKRLKKASSKVGILNADVDERRESSAPERKHVVHKTRDTQDDQSLLLSSKSLDSEAVSGSSPSAGTPDTETVHPKPLLICRIIVSYPLTSFFAITLIHLATFSISAGLWVSGYNVFPLVFDTLPLYTYNDARINELAWKSRNNYDGWLYRPVYGSNFYTGYRSRIKDTVEIIYELPNVNILTKPYFEWIRTTEERLFGMPDFKRDFCLRISYYTCYKPQSLLRLFDGTYSHLDSIFTDTEFSNITNVIYMATMYNETKEFVELFLGKDSVVTPELVSSSITRTFFFMGWPLYRMANNEYGTFTDLESFLINKFKPEIENIRDHYLVERLFVYYLSKIMYEYDLSHQALKDLMLAIGSVSFILVFMSIQTGSVVVTLLGIMSILSSFFMTNLIYRYVLQYIYFGFFHIISIFLILGIGADDLFVFYDTWRLTGNNKYPSDAHRLSDCYRRAAKTTFVTSCTTMMAFFVSGLSPLLPVKTFGIFSGLLVLLNYIWVIVYFPTIIMLHHLKIKYIWYRIRDCICPCFRSSKGNWRKRRNSEVSTATISESLSDSGCSKNDVSNTEKEKSEKSTYMDQSGDTELKDSTDNKINDKLPSIHFEFSKNTSSVDDHGTNRPPIDLQELEDQRHLQEWEEKHRNQPKRAFDQRNRIIKFLKNAFFDFMMLRIVKFLIPVILLMASIFFIMSASTLEPDTHQLRLWRPGHNYAKASDRHYFSFIRNQDDEYQRLYLVWGLEKSDVSVCNMKSADFCFGNNRRDEQFDMNGEEAQLAFKALCERLDNIDETTAEKLRIRRNTVTGKLHVACFAGDFDKYFQAEMNKTSGGGRKYPESMSLTIPVTPSNVKKFMTANPSMYVDQLPTDFQNYFEILVGYWLTDGYTTRASKDYFQYNTLLTEETDERSENVYFYLSGLYYGTRLRYLAIEVNTTMNVYSLGYKEGLPVYHAWEDFMNSINKQMPHPVNKGFQVTENLWHWIHVQEILANSAIMGIVIGICSAWPILVFTTFNYIIGSLAVITIGLVTACVVGMIPLVGWKLGVLESINLCMVVGLSVDYIVHLAEAYRMSESERRLDKTRDMLEAIGLSVVSGAFTTIGAAVFMLFAQIRFFFQFGIFIISTVGIALVFSLFGFTTLMSICGPQGRTGSLMPVCTALCARLEKGGTGEEEEEKLECVGPTVITDRIYNWLSYRGGEKK